MRFAMYCACGSGCSGTVKPHDEIVRVWRVWRTLHTNPECKPCDRRIANNAKRRLERLEPA